MKRPSIIKIVAAATLSAAAQGAFAADGTVNFVGEITDQPCSVAPNSQNLTVPLGKVARTVLDGAVGKRATPAKFTIDLLNCPAGAPNATVSFAAPGDVDVPALLRVGVGEVGGTFAKGVAIELGDSAGVQIPLGAKSREYTLAAGDNALQFQAVYVSTQAAVTTGPANAIAQFTVAYP